MEKINPKKIPKKSLLRYVILVLIGLSFILYVPVKNNLLHYKINNEASKKIDKSDYSGAVGSLEGVKDMKWIVPILKSLALRNRAVAYHSLGNYENASKYYRLAAKIGSGKSSFSTQNLSDALLVEGKISEAILILEQELTNKEDSDKLFVNMSLGQVYLGYYGEEYFDSKKAIFFCGKAFEIGQKTQPFTHKMLIEALIFNNEYKKAEELNNDLIEKFGQMPMYKEFSIMIKERANNPNPAER